MKLTVKLSKPNKTILELLKQDHGLIGPDLNWNTIEGAELYYGTSYASEPTWVAFLSGGTNEPIADLNNRGALALLFIPVDNRYMLFSFGYGNHKVAAHGWEKDFGLKVVLNAIDPQKVKSVDAKTIDTVVMDRRIQLSKENRIHDFGFEIDKDFLKSITGTASNANFANVLSGSENLTITCDVTLQNFHAKASDIYAVFTSNNYQTHYAWIDNVKAVQDIAIIEPLNDLLVAEYNSALAGNPTNLDTACPDIVDHAAMASFKLRGHSDRVPYEFVSIAVLLESMAAGRVGDVDIARLEDTGIQSYDGNGAPSGNWSLLDWLTFECTYNGDLYILSEGLWYQVNRNYYQDVSNSVAGIMASPGEYLALPATPHQTETAYLRNYAVTATEVILDCKLFYGYGNSNSCEVCDIYNGQREFIHVKDGGSSSKLSHLFNQGFVSASAFLGDVNFREHIRVKLREENRARLATQIPDNPNPRNFTIVYRILKSGATLTLPFFTKVVLVEMHRKVKSMGYRFRLEWLPKQ